jgi:hypothetical protein
MMKPRLKQAEYQELLAHLREVDKLDEKMRKIDYRIRRLLGQRKEDDQVVSDRIYDMVYNAEDVGETLALLGITVEES